MNKLNLNYNLKKTAGATAKNNALCTVSNTEKNVVIDYSILQQLNLNNIAMEAIIEQLKIECNHFSNVGFFKVCSDEGVLNGGHNNYCVEYDCIVIPSVKKRVFLDSDYSVLLDLPDYDW